MDYNDILNLDERTGEYRYPQPKTDTGISEIFKSIFKSNETTKTANLDKNELGLLDLGVRQYKRLALVAKHLHFGLAEEWFNEQAEILTSTSLSKVGWLLELLVTQKSPDRRKGNVISNLPNSKWNIYRNPSP